MATNKIAVLGTGNGAYAIAADLALKGNSVNLYAPAHLFGRIEPLAENMEIEATGIINGKARLNLVTDQIDLALEGVRYVCIAVPAYRQEDYASALSGHIAASQTLIIFNGCFGSLAFAKILSSGGSCPLIADTTSLPFVTRRVNSAKVNILSSKKLGISFFPADCGENFIDELRAALYPFERVYGDVIECGLSMVNPTMHAGTCLVNLSSIERPDVNFYLYEHGFTPSGVKINTALDRERKNIGDKMGYCIKPMEEFCGLQDHFTWQNLFSYGHGSYSLTGICGPNSINDRYLTEDIPYGLVPWSGLGSIMNVPTPVTDSVIQLFNIVHDKNWTTDGRSVQKLGLHGMSYEDIKTYIQYGK